MAVKGTTVPHFLPTTLPNSHSQSHLSTHSALSSLSLSKSMDLVLAATFPQPRMLASTTATTTIPPTAAPEADNHVPQPTNHPPYVEVPIPTTPPYNHIPDAFISLFQIFSTRGSQQSFIKIYLIFFFFFTGGARPWVAPLCLRPCLYRSQNLVTCTN
jgi:hypothetical protein